MGLAEPDFPDTSTVDTFVRKLIQSHVALLAGTISEGRQVLSTPVTTTGSCANLVSCRPLLGKAVGESDHLTKNRAGISG
jgi:hypothetical protein